MRAVAFVLGMLACLATIDVAAATVHITDDEGGYISQYTARYAAIRDSGEDVAIDGLCFSACTLVLGIVPRDRICITRNTLFGFHAAHWPGQSGREGISTTHTQLLLATYPPRLRGMISRQGGLTDKLIFITGPELAGMFRYCR